jgi:SAM-dependent methyltransferase
VAAAANATLPDYAVEMAAFHRAFAGELQELVSRVPAQPGDRVLDVGCGDGFYCELWARRPDGIGRVVGLDVNEAYLDVARRRSADRGDDDVAFVQGDLKHADGILGQDFDVVWCAQSLYSLPDPVVALRQMAAIVRPGGIVAVLENDTLHQLLVPWPTRVELALRVAEREALEDESSRPGKFYVGRRLPATLAAAGLEPAGFHTQCIDRVAPLDPVVELFLKSYFVKLLERTSPYLEPAVLAELRDLVLPEGEAYLPRQPYFTLTWLNTLAWARRPA